jgi:cellulase
LSKVSNSATADGSTPFFKIYQDTWGKNAAGSTGSDDYWGTKDLNTHCGKLDVKIPTGLAPGDYLLRAEAIALHSAGGSGGAQVNHYPPTHEVHTLDPVKLVLPHLLPAHYYWKRHY